MARRKAGERGPLTRARAEGVEGEDVEAAVDDEREGGESDPPLASEGESTGAFSYDGGPAALAARSRQAAWA